MKNGILAELKRLKQMKTQKESNLEQFMNVNKVISNPKRSYKCAYSQELKPKSQQIVKSIPHQIRDIFRGFTFCFPVKDLNLTPHMIKSLSEQITARKGEVVNFTQNIKNIKVNFLVCSRKINLQQLEKKVQGKLFYDQLIDVLYVKNCIKKQKLLGTDDYLLFEGMPEELHIKDSDQQEDQGSVTMCVLDKIKKKVKSQHCSQNTNPTQFQQQLLPLNLPIQNYIKHCQTDKKQQILCQLKGKDIGGKPTFQTNNFLAQQLNKLHKIYTNEKDIGRKIAYMKAVSIIKNYPKEINSPQDLNEIKGIGNKLKDKIKQLLTTGKLQRLQNLEHTDKNKAIAQLTRVWSIGPTKAQQLYSRGINTVSQLKLNTHLLNKNQLIGLKYCSQFQQKIPREKVTKIFSFVKSQFHQLIGRNDLHHIEVCGSYRRKKSYCGDIDIIITRKDGEFQKTLLIDLIVKLESKGFLTDHLTYPKVATDRSSMSYMGVCVFEDYTHHRIDIKYYPVQQYAFALLYFTGSGQFNRSIRIEARKKNLSLSDHGFKQFEADKNRKKNKNREQIDSSCFTEQDIFKFLGLQYRAPQDRNI